MRRTRSGLAVILVLWGRFCLPMMARAQGTGKEASIRVVISLDSGAAPYLDVERGFRQGLQERPELSLVREGEALADGGFKGETLHFCVGPKALKKKVESSGARILATLVLGKEELVPADRVTGVYLRHDLEAQLRLISRFFPHRKRIAILHGGDRTEALADRAREIGTSMGLTVLDRRMSSMKDLSRLMRWVGREADLLWGLPDPVVYTPSTARSLLQFSLRNRIPFLAPSKTWVRAGAVVGFDWDFVDLGQQCAALLGKMLAAPEGSPLPEGEAPRTLRWDTNENTARYLRLELPDPKP